MVICPNCFNKAMYEHGYYTYKEEKKRQYKCAMCNRVTAFPLKRRPKGKANV